MFEFIMLVTLLTIGCSANMVLLNAIEMTFFEHLVPVSEYCIPQMNSFGFSFVYSCTHGPHMNSLPIFYHQRFQNAKKYNSHAFRSRINGWEPWLTLRKYETLDDIVRC